MKKFLAMLLALVMVMGMSVTVFATETINDKDPQFVNTATIKGVMDETTTDNDGKVVDPITVKAYQIITYNSNGYYEVATPTKGTIQIDSAGLMPGSTKPKLTPSSSNASTILGQIRNNEVAGRTGTAVCP